MAPVWRTGKPPTCANFVYTVVHLDPQSQMVPFLEVGVVDAVDALIPALSRSWHFSTADSKRLLHLSLAGHCWLALGGHLVENMSFVCKCGACSKAEQCDSSGRGEHL